MRKKRARMLMIRARASSALAGLIAALVAWCATAAAQQSAPAALDPEAIDCEVERALRERDMDEWRRELAGGAGGDLRASLVRLNLAARAADYAEVERLVDELSRREAGERAAAAGAVKRFAGNSCTARRLYYERIAPGDTDGAESFVRARCVAPDELDAWLDEQARRSDEQRNASYDGSYNNEWLALRLRRLSERGRAGGVIDGYAARVRESRCEKSSVGRYLWANKVAGSPQSVAWLADECAPETAFESFRLGGWLQGASVDAAIKLYERAARMEFTPRDAELIRTDEMIRSMFVSRGGSARRYENTKRLVVNYEKQFRYDTKLRLAGVYLSVGRAGDAQRLAEEIEQARGDAELSPAETSFLAGAVQAASGERAIETGILMREGDEAADVAYWIGRLRYYAGRREWRMTIETCERALGSLPPDDGERRAAERLGVMKELWQVVEYGNQVDSATRRAANKMLRDKLKAEFYRYVPESPAARLVIHEIDDDFDGLRDEIFARDRNLLARMLAAQNEWSYYDASLISDILESGKLTPNRRAELWTQLEAVAREGDASRLYHLAYAMEMRGEAGRRIPVLKEFLRRAPAESGEFRGAVKSLLDAQVETGAWRNAEQTFDLHEGRICASRLPPALVTVATLDRLALAAARDGAADDAVRLWKRRINFDRRDMSALRELAATAARDKLIFFYTDEEARRGVSSSTVEALKLLRAAATAPAG